MPKFAYKGVDANGEEAFGIVEADSEADALTEIGRKGLFVEEVHAATVSDEWRVRRQDAREQRERRQAHLQDRARKRHTRQRLVVRYKDGRTKYGVCFALNPRDTGFHLDLVNAEGIASGDVIQVRFSDLKAVFYVKSFDGKFDKHAHYREWSPEGNELIVEFQDGEVIRGFSLHAYDSEVARFHLIPSEPESNNISILIEKSAVTAIFSPEEYEARQAEKKEARKSQEVSEDLSQEETMGDFYFETRNYPAALEQYHAAAKRFPQSYRLRKKMLASEYNIGVQYIKRREYKEALVYMERILKVDPKNAHARKKALQLRRILERSERSDKREEPVEGNSQAP
ncbi:MAG: hypothetical protein JXR94_23160 [Candidatus Hydrogenedentes bacterium]|nr:hypothetical protein [Candidatus Hydrogenedentota bacterium]